MYFMRLLASHTVRRMFRTALAPTHSARSMAGARGDMKYGPDERTGPNSTRWIGVHGRAE